MSVSATEPDVDDLCAACERPIKVRDKAWLMMSSTDGLVAAANLCGLKSCSELRDALPGEIADRLRLRRWAPGRSA